MQFFVHFYIYKVTYITLLWNIIMWLITLITLCITLLCYYLHCNIIYSIYFITFFCNKNPVILSFIKIHYSICLYIILLTLFQTLSYTITFSLPQFSSPRMKWLCSCHSGATHIYFYTSFLGNCLLVGLAFNWIDKNDDAAGCPMLFHGYPFFPLTWFQFPLFRCPEQSIALCMLTSLSWLQHEEIMYQNSLSHNSDQLIPINDCCVKTDVTLFVTKLLWNKFCTDLSI